MAAEVLRAGSAHPDAELIAACDRFCEHEHRYLRFFHGLTRIEDDDERDAALVGVDARTDNPEFATLLGMRATTVEGMRALARVAFTDSPDLHGDLENPSGGAGAALLAVLALSLVGPYSPIPAIERGEA